MHRMVGSRGTTDYGYNVAIIEGCYIVHNGCSKFQCVCGYWYLCGQLLFAVRASLAVAASARNVPSAGGRPGLTQDPTCQ